MATKSPLPLTTFQCEPLRDIRGAMSSALEAIHQMASQSELETKVAVSFPQKVQCGPPIPTLGKSVLSTFRNCMLIVWKQKVIASVERCKRKGAIFDDEDDTTDGFATKLVYPKARGSVLTEMLDMKGSSVSSALSMTLRVLMEHIQVYRSLVNKPPTVKRRKVSEPQQEEERGVTVEPIGERKVEPYGHIELLWDGIKYVTPLY